LANQEVLAWRVLGGVLPLHCDVGHVGLPGNAFLGQLDLLCRMAFCVCINLANLSAGEFAIADPASLNAGTDQVEHLIRWLLRLRRLGLVP
jgi:hypothetical protein